MSVFKEMDTDTQEIREEEETKKAHGEDMKKWFEVLSVLELKKEYVFQTQWGKDRLRYAKHSTSVGDHNLAADYKRWALKNFNIAQQFHRELCRRGA